MAPADTIIKSVSERPNGMFPPGNHVRICGKSVTRASEAGFGIISRKFHFFKSFKKYQNFWDFLKLFEKKNLAFGIWRFAPNPASEARVTDFPHVRT